MCLASLKWGSQHSGRKTPSVTDTSHLSPDVEPAARHAARAAVGTGQADKPEVRFEVGVQGGSPGDPRAGVAVVADQPDVSRVLERLPPDLRVGLQDRGARHEVLAVRGGDQGA